MTGFYKSGVVLLYGFVFFNMFSRRSGDKWFLLTCLSPKQHRKELKAGGLSSIPCQQNAWRICENKESSTSDSSRIKTQRSCCHRSRPDHDLRFCRIYLCWRSLICFLLHTDLFLLFIIYFWLYFLRELMPFYVHIRNNLVQPFWQVPGCIPHQFHDTWNPLLYEWHWFQVSWNWWGMQPGTCQNGWTRLFRMWT